MTCFTSLYDVNRYSRIDVSGSRTRRPVDDADHGSETDPKVRNRGARGAIDGGASPAVSRVRQAAYVDARPSSHHLAGSPDTGTVSMCQVPMIEGSGPWSWCTWEVVASAPLDLGTEVTSVQGTRIVSSYVTSADQPHGIWYSTVYQ